MVLGFLALGGLLFWYEVIRIRRHGGGQREVAAFVIGMLVAVAFGLALLLGLPVPNPTKAIQTLFEPVTHMILTPR